MDEVKQLITNFIDLERLADQLFLQRKLEERNAIVEELNNLTLDPEPPHTFNLANIITEPLTMLQERRVNRFGHTTVKPRDLFKITEYENPEYGKLWACYVSVANPIIDTVKTIDNCFIAAKVNGELKMISQFFYDGMDDFMWKHGGGIELNLYELGKVVAVERLLTPLKDEWSLEEYMLDR
jgi:hypothetical protein